ncbi:MAG: citrate lyase acyl carrier protein [Candidatus Thorarchaeota archaeon]
MKTAQAGSLESCDILITVEATKEGSGIQIQLDSPSAKQFGEMIHAEITEVTHKLGIKDVKIIAVDKGALSYCIRARTETALTRAANEE